MESQHGSNLKNIRKKRATAQQSIVSLSCLVCIAFAAIWGFHAGSGNSSAVEAKKMSASSSVAENESSESKADSYTKAKVYVSSSGGTAEEIDCFEAKDADSAKAIADTLTARVESQKKVFENYVPEEMTKLNDPVLVTNGNYVYLCLSNDNDKAKEIIG